MNGEAIALVRAQALAQWVPERREPAVTGQVLEPGARVPAAPLQALLAAHAEIEVEMALGQTAQFVSRLAPAAAQGVPQPTPITTTAPLAATPGNVAQLAAGLKQAIQASGLFYESHLADWVEGKGTRNELAREPQGAFASPASRPADGLQAAQQGPAPLPLTPQVEGLVQRQLEVLEFRAAQWQGEAWPGQRADIRIEEEDAGPGRDAAGSPAWSATLRVSMPGLGAVEGRISLAGRAVRLAIGATDPQAARTLAGARADLARALGAQGLTLAEAKVEHDARPRSR